jgi:hypothetical protein
VRLEINSSVESTRAEQDDVESIVLMPTEWLVYLPHTVGHRVSLVLMKTSKISDCIVFEARSENIPVLKMMEVKLREFLKGKNEARLPEVTFRSTEHNLNSFFHDSFLVVSYNIKLQDTTTKNKPMVASLHILRNKLFVVTGFPPNHTILLDYTFVSFQNGITLSADQRLIFTGLPNIVVVSDQTDDIWKTIQGCMQAVERLSIARSTKTQYVYYNLPTRPCKYIYMNLPDKRKTPHLSHDYINVFHIGSVYQNCWRTCTKTKDEEDSTETQQPPPPPPREKPPPLPPKPRNRPPNSPLPPIPSCARAPPPLPSPRRLDEPPSLPLPRLPEKHVRKEIQYVVYSSKPVIGQIFVIQVVFFQKNDYTTLEVSTSVLSPFWNCGGERLSG